MKMSIRPYSFYEEKIGCITFERSFQPLSSKNIEVKLYVFLHLNVERNEFIFPKKNYSESNESA